MDADARGGVIRYADIAALIPGPLGERAALAIRRGTLDIKLSIPAAPNVQSPHEQDEIYVVLRGRGTLVWEDGRQDFGPGDLLFVAAQTDHHYENFSENLALWRIFYGQQGGEIPR